MFLKGFVILILLTLSGCTGYLSEEQMLASIKVCEVNGGLAQLRVEPISTNRVFCNNGAVFYMKD